MDFKKLYEIQQDQDEQIRQIAIKLGHKDVGPNIKPFAGFKQSLWRTIWDKIKNKM